MQRPGDLIGVVDDEAVLRLDGRISFAKIVPSNEYQGLGQTRISEESVIDPTNRLLFTGHGVKHNDGIRIWDLRGGRLIQHLQIGDVPGLRISPDGNTLYTAVRKDYRSIRSKLFEWPIKYRGSHVHIGPARQIKLPEFIYPNQYRVGRHGKTSRYFVS